MVGENQTLKTAKLRYNEGMRKKYTGNLKAQIVMEMLKEEKTISQIASEYEVHPTQLNKWKAIVKDHLPEILEDNRKKENVIEKQQKQQIEELYAEIGRLTTQLTWLKKKSGIRLEQRKTISSS